jgi:hypothetical protein
MTLARRGQDGTDQLRGRGFAAAASDANENYMPCPVSL